MCRGLLSTTGHTPESTCDTYRSQGWVTEKNFILNKHRCSMEQTSEDRICVLQTFIFHRDHISQGTPFLSTVSFTPSPQSSNSNQTLSFLGHPILPSASGDHSMQHGCPWGSSQASWITKHCTFCGDSLKFAPECNFPATNGQYTMWLFRGSCHILNNHVWCVWALPFPSVGCKQLEFS